MTNPTADKVLALIPVQMASMRLAGTPTADVKGSPFVPADLEKAQAILARCSL